MSLNNISMCTACGDISAMPIGEKSNDKESSGGYSDEDQESSEDASEAESDMVISNEHVVNGQLEKPKTPPDHTQLPPKLKSFFAKVNWKNVLAYTCQWIAYFLCAAGFSVIGPFYPNEAMQKGASSAIIGVIVSASPLTVVIVAPVMGYLLPYTGAWIPTMAGLLLMGTAFLLLGLALYIPSTWGFILFCLLLRVLEGVGTALFITATYSTCAKLFPNSIGTLIGLFQVAVGTGFSLGRPIGGLLYYLGGFKLPFVVGGITTLVSAFPCGMLVKNIRIDKREQQLSWRVILSLSTDLLFILIALVPMIAITTTAYTIPILQPFLVQEFDIGQVEVALIFFIEAASYSILDLPAGAVSDRLRGISSVLVIILGIVILILGNVILASQEWTAKRLWVVCVSMAVRGIGQGISSVPVYQNLITVASKYINTDNKTEKEGMISFISGVVPCSSFLGEFLGPVLGGVLYTFVSFPTTALVIAEIALAQAILLAAITMIDRYIKFPR